MIGEKVTLRVRMSAGEAHYAGELVNGSHIVDFWGDVGTELAIRLWGDESRSWAMSTSASRLPSIPATSWSTLAGLRRWATPL